MSLWKTNLIFLFLFAAFPILRSNCTFFFCQTGYSKITVKTCIYYPCFPIWLKKVWFKYFSEKNVVFFLITPITLCIYISPACSKEGRWKLNQTIPKNYIKIFRFCYGFFIADRHCHGHCHIYFPKFSSFCFICKVTQLTIFVQN